MAVNESAVGMGRGRQAGSRGPGRASEGVVRFGLPALTLAAWLAAALPVQVAAQVVADPNAGASRPTVVQTANGLPQVNITRPSAAGVSVNAYSQFDVPRTGVIPNNSPTAVSTQQAGYINGNPNLLPGGSARIIVNQATGTLPSQLRGYLEVAGPGSEIIIANPNGILVDGAGFINTSRATLTTGVPVFGGSGSLDAFRVTGGQIRVDGAGLNAANVDQVDLIARAVSANAALYANRLNVVAGANQVDRATLAATPIAGAGAAPAPGIDVSHLGGMYANKILLASTELGVGVSNRGVLAAQAGDLTLTAQGKLVLAGQTNASGSLAVDARDGIDNSGATYGGGAVTVRTGGALTNSGTLAAQQGLTVNAGSVASAGTLGAGVNADGSIGQVGDLVVTATGSLAATGTNVAGGSATLQGAEATLAGSQTAANGDLTLAATAGDLNLTGATASAGRNLEAMAAGELNNVGGTLTANGVDSKAVISATSIDNTGGALGGNGDVTVHARALVNAGNASLVAAGALGLNVTQSVDNRGGTLYGGRGVTLDQAGATLANDGGTILGGQDVTVNIASMNNAGGIVRANRDIAVTGALGGSGEMSAARDLSLDVAGDYLNDADNRLNADGDMRLAASGTIINAGQLAAVGGLTVSGANVVNTAEADMNGTTTTVQAANAITNAGRIEGDTVSTRSATLDNTGTVIGNVVQVQAADVSNTGPAAIIAAAEDLKIYATNSVSNLDGATIYSAGDLQIARDGTRDADGMLANQVDTLTNRSATIEADGDIDIAARTVSNTRASIVTEAGAPVETARETLVAWYARLEGDDRKYHYSLTFAQWRWDGEKAEVSGDMMNALRQPVTVEVPKETVANLDTNARTLTFTESPTETFRSRPRFGGEGVEWEIFTRPLTTNATQHYENIEDTGSTYRITFWPDWDPATQIRPDQVIVRHDLGTDSHDYSEISRTTATTTATDRLVSATEPGKIQAQGAIRINSAGGAILNQSSIIAAGGDVRALAADGGIRSIGTALQQSASTSQTSTFYWHQKSGHDSDTQLVPYPTTPQAPTTVMALPALVTSNQAVQIAAQDVTIATVNAQGQTVTGGDAPAGGAGQAGVPNLTLPANGLFHFQTAPDAAYLVATDPRFTQYQSFISSDYLLAQLGLDPQKLQKRLGDGFYEEKLVRDQVTQLTGRTFLAGYSDQLEAYQALMDNGVAYARAFGLAPGVGLTDAQMQQLTTDMVWLVSQEVTLPDGSRQSVLVPKVYLAQASAVNLSDTGSLVAGRSVSVAASGNAENSGRIVGDVATRVLGGNVVNRGAIGNVNGGTTVVQGVQDVRNLGGKIAGQDVLVSAGRDVVNETQTITAVRTLENGYSAGATGVGAVASISAAGSTAVLAGRDISLNGGAIDAGKSTLLAAGRDLNVGTVAFGTTQDTASPGGQSYGRDRTMTNLGSTIQAGETVVAVAGRDATLTGSTIRAGGNASVVAARDVTVTAAIDTHTHSEASLGGKVAEYKQSSYDETARGSLVQAGNNVTLAAGQESAVNAVLESQGIQPVADVSGSNGNLVVLGSGVSTEGGSAQLIATGDVTVGTVNETHDSQYWMESRRSGFMSKEKTTKESSEHQSVAVGSVVSADSIAGNAGRDLTITGSTVAATNDVNLDAGRNLTITTAQNTSSSHSFEQTTKSGFGATGAGLSYGKRDQKDTVNDNAVTQTASLVGSTDGSVHLKAGSTLKVTGSELVAARDVTGVAADVMIETSKGTQHHDETHEIKQSGFTLGVSGGAIGSAISAGQKVGSATKSQDGRASALWGIAAGRDAYDAVTGAPDAVKSLADGKGPAGTAVTLSFGTSKSKQTLTQDGTSHTGSSVRAGGTATFIATGVDADGNKTAGNLDIVGSGVSATRAGLAAKGDVNIVSATDTNESHSTNKSSSGSIGVSYGAQGFGVSVSASAAKGNSDSTGATQVNSHVSGSESVSIVSGKDTNILGGVVSGGKVSADVGGNLNLASRQDTEESKARQQSMGGGLSFSQGGGLSGSFSASKGKADGSYANVTEQSGIRAGDGGFDINVKGNTDLKGAVIASTATEDKNKLKTGTLTWGDIENKADYSATSFGVSGGFSFGPKTVDKQTGQESGKNTGGVGPMIPQNESGSQRGLAQSGISGGTIMITDTANQKQDVATLNRDTANTNTTVGRNPDIDNVLSKQADMMAAAQAAGEAVARTVGDIATSRQKEAQKAFDQARLAYDQDPSDANRTAMADAQAGVDGWREGGEYCAALHAAGGAMVAGMGGRQCVGRCDRCRSVVAGGKEA